MMSPAIATGLGTLPLLSLNSVARYYHYFARNEMKPWRG